MFSPKKLQLSLLVCTVMILAGVRNGPFTIRKVSFSPVFAVLKSWAL